MLEELRLRQRTIKTVRSPIKLLKYDETYRDKARLPSVIIAVSSSSFSPFSKQIKLVLIFLLNLNLREFSGHLKRNL